MLIHSRVDLKKITVRRKDDIREYSRQYQRLYKLKYPEIVKARNDKYRNGNRELLRQKEGIRRKSNPQKSKYREYRKGAKENNLDYDLSFECFMSYWGLPCYYCGKVIDTIGLDRKDNSSGYTSANIVPCCTTCNYMKSDMGKDEFLQHISKIYILNCQSGPAHDASRVSGFAAPVLSPVADGG